MPGDEGRNWLIQISKSLAPKSHGLTTDKIAQGLCIQKPSLLTSCIRNSPSNTTRQIIKLLYPPSQLQTIRGKDVPVEKRKLIQGKRPLTDCKGIANISCQLMQKLSFKKL